MQQSFSEKYNGKKVSEIFKEYVDPVLQIYFQDFDQIDLDALDQMLKVPWMIWNSLVFKKNINIKIDYSASIDLLIRNRPEVKFIIEMMRKRKKDLFNDYDFLFGHYKLSFDENASELKIWVEARQF